MPLVDIVWPTSNKDLFDLGVKRVKAFCEKNDIEVPDIEAVPANEWYVGACAYYRATYIKINLDDCGRCCTDAQSRNWTWPGSTTDCEPYGVLCHELGHHCDRIKGVRKGLYYSEYCEVVMTLSGEQAITSYCPNPAEWFAEMFRVFVTNHGLLKQLRPKTYNLLRKDWIPLGPDNWQYPLGANVPSKILKTLRNKGAV